MMKIAVIGAGVYGSYTIDALLKQYPQADITLFDVGDSSLKSEQEIGYYSKLKKALYKGLTDGRWFGFGGASVKWGGQLLTFTENDFKNQSKYLHDIVHINKVYKHSMLKKFNIINNHEEHWITKNLFTKTGVWVSYFHRDFFSHFKITKRKQVHILHNSRVIKLKSDDKKKITKLIYSSNGKIKEESFDFYFLAAGAFENARIMLVSGLTDSDKVHFSDHLSQKIFKIKKGTVIGKEDYVFRITGTSLITKRMVGEIDDISYYAHPVLNMDFPFFQALKTLMFKREYSWKAIRELFMNIPQATAFVWSILIKKKMYVLNGEWYMYIDIENPTKESYVTLSTEKDAYGEYGLDVYYSIGDTAKTIYEKAKEQVKEHLIQTGKDYEECTSEIDVQTCEDIYHPYGMFDNFNSIDEYYSHFDNMLVITTGILPRSGGINPTASVLPLIDEFIEHRFPHK